MEETKKRSLIKAIIYRIWVLFSTYVMLLLTGKSFDDAIVPTIIINIVWTCSYYIYDRIWTRIQWGRE